MARPKFDFTSPWVLIPVGGATLTLAGPILLMPIIGIGYLLNQILS